MMTELTDDIQQKEKTAQFIWTGFILVFFVIQAIIWMIAITLTANDKSHAVVAGYDEKALNWDAQVAIRVASTKLGWKTEMAVDPIADIQHVHLITLKLTDADNRPLTHASIQLTAFHRARAAERQQIQFVETDEGVYSGDIQIRKSGQWQFEGSARRGEDTFLINEKHFLNVSR